MEPDSVGGRSAPAGGVTDWAADADSEPSAGTAGYPGPVTLTRSRKKWSLILLGSVAFSAVSAALVANHITRTPYELAVVALGVPLFAFLAVRAALMLLPGAGLLTLDASGFEIVRMRGHTITRWEDASRFVVWTYRRNKAVVFDRRSGGLLPGFSARMAGHNSSLRDTYGQSAEALADLMNRWRTRALAAATSGNDRTPR